MGIADELAEIPLVDQHCHPVVLDDLDGGELARMLSEAFDPAPEGTSGFDSHVGLSVRRWCAPVLGLDPHADPTDYVARRTTLGATESSRRLLQACGTSDLLVDTGLPLPNSCSLAEMAELSEARVHEVVRLETVAEELAATEVSAGDFGAVLAEELAKRATTAVGFKTIAAYRVGLDLPPTPPPNAEVWQAADRWLARCARTGRYRLDERTLVAHAVWSCLPLGLPLQVHTGFGDPDLTLHRADPSLLTPFVRALPEDAAPLVLLHGYPYHRHAAFLASVFPKVVLDVSLAINHTGPRAAAVLAETLEVAPFGSLMYASDGVGLAELHHLGAAQFRQALGRVLEEWLAHDVLTPTDASRFARMIAADNARRVYRLDSR
ncbi:MAG TPA: amidohydrolase family protein [Nocardioidaceae bacterium]|nr:amidohydrolase family protein [Nocardioidaceae bacterium]